MIWSILYRDVQQPQTGGCVLTPYTEYKACQFWSILTLLAINKIHQLIDKAGLENAIIVTSTIYDSIYFEIRDDANVIKWLNDNLIPIMEKDFIPNQTVPNEANLEIGLSWAKLVELPHNISVEAITSTIEKVKN